MYVGADMIGMVKTNTNVLCQETIEKITKYWTGGYYLLFRINPMVPRVRPLMAIVYKYNVQKVLSFIVTDDKGIKNPGLTHLSQYHE